MLDPAKPSSADLSMVDIDRTRAEDDGTVLVALDRPLADLGSVLAGWYVFVVKDGTDVFDASTLPVGTGPFALHSWSPGDRTVLVRNEHYWEPELPLLDEVEIIQIAEPEARVNAFLSGEVDMIDQLPPVRAQTLRQDPDVTLLMPVLRTMAALQMRADVAPFDDVQVRQAMRLAVDRRAMIDTVYLGFAEVGNDLYGLGAPFYAGGLPQRTYDPERTRALLREAGHEALTVTLTTADSSPRSARLGQRCSRSRPRRRGSRSSWRPCRRTTTRPRCRASSPSPTTTGGTTAWTTTTGRPRPRTPPATRAGGARSGTRGSPRPGEPSSPMCGAASTPSCSRSSTRRAT